MDQVTQQNAAMVEQSNSASSALAGEAGALNRLIARFQVGQGAPVPRAGDRTGSVARPAPTAMAPKTLGRGGAARNPRPAAAQEDWQEF